MEVVTIIDDLEFHGQVATVAYGEFGGLRNLILNLGEENVSYVWNQYENDFCIGGSDVYLIDIDELRQSKGFEHLSVDQCFAELLTNSDMDYHLRTYRYVMLPSGEILNESER